MEVQEFITLMKEKCGLNPGDSLLLGFSGGPDSLCLLNLLVESGYLVTAIHVDHSLRASSAEQATCAIELCQERGVTCLLHQVQVADFAHQQKLSIEESARELRYKVLFSEAARIHAAAVLVGHNADDQVETVLMHLIRGSGSSGLAGMRQVEVPNQWSSSIPLVRPLLNCYREEIDQYLAAHHLTPLLDESNLDTRYTRNRIRHELIPKLETYNPQFKDRILHMAEVVGKEDAYLEEENERNWHQVIRESGKRFLVVDRLQVAELDLAMRRRMIQGCIHKLAPALRNIDFQVIDRAARFCSTSTSTNHIDLVGGIELFRIKKDSLVMAFSSDPLVELWPQLPSSSRIDLPYDGEVEVGEHWKLVISHNATRDVIRDPFKGQVDASRLVDPLILDTIQPGDRFVPYGFEGKSIKLGDFWTNEGLPARARKNWPLIRRGHTIIWVPGFRISEEVKVDADSSEILTFEMLKTL